jgi:hypothetical protein
MLKSIDSSRRRSTGSVLCDAAGRNGVLKLGDSRTSRRSRGPSSRARVEAAEREARRRQASESPGVEWIYLRVDGEWVAKRTPTDAAFYPAPRLPLWRGALGDPGGPDFFA